MAGTWSMGISFCEPDMWQGSQDETRAAARPRNASAPLSPWEDIDTGREKPVDQGGSSTRTQHTPRCADAAALACGYWPDRRCPRGLLGAGFCAADLGMPVGDSAGCMAQPRTADSLSFAAAPRAEPGSVAAGIRYRRVGGALVLYRRTAESIRVFVSRTSADSCTCLAAARHVDARGLRRCLRDPPHLRA